MWYYHCYYFIYQKAKWETFRFGSMNNMAYGADGISFANTNVDYLLVIMFSFTHCFNSDVMTAELTWKPAHFWLLWMKCELFSVVCDLWWGNVLMCLQLYCKTPLTSNNGSFWKRKAQLKSDLKRFNQSPVHFQESRSSVFFYYFGGFAGSERSNLSWVKWNKKEIVVLNFGFRTSNKGCRLMTDSAIWWTQSWI